MLEDKHRDSGLAEDKPSDTGPRSSISEKLEGFERRQKELWRLTYLILVILAVFFAWTSFDTIRSLARQFEALPIGLVVLIVLFVVYAWKRTQEMSELRRLVRGVEQRTSAEQANKDLDHLFEIIARSQQGYRDLIDSFDDVLLALNLDGEIRAVNRSFADLVGAPFQKIIGQPLGEFLEEGSGEGPELIRQAMPRFLERRHWTGVVQVRLKSQQSVHYFDCVAHAMVRADKVHGVTVLGRDITALRKNEARFTELFETLQEGIYIVTPDNRILDVNPALVRMLGFDSKEDLVARKVSDVFPDQAMRQTLQDEVNRQPMLEGREITLLRKDGRSIVCLNTAAAVKDNTGRVVRYQGALIDITSRREIERRLYQQQEFARRLVDSFPDLILVLNSVAQYTFVSPRSKDILGYEPDEISAMEFGHCAHPEDMGAVKTLFGDIVGARESFASLEVRVRHKLGEWRRIRFNFSPLFDEFGKIGGVVLSGRDVTDLKRLEEQLIQAEKLAAMGQMLAGVAHELNNPLTAILGVTELLRERSDLEDSAKRQLDLTHRQARRAARIVQNLLEFSLPSATPKKPLDLHTVLERTLQLHEHSLRRNLVDVDFRPNSDLPWVVGDANQLIQVFLNLVMNAEQAIREIRESGRIQIRLAASGSRVAVTVQDDGVGIRPEALPKLFDPFYTTKRPGGGTGLGLSICMSIVQEHNGTIEAEALPAGGSAFTVYLPAVVPETQSVAVPASSGVVTTRQEAAPNSLPNGLKDQNILVLDDEESIRQLLAEGLGARGLNVDCAAHPDEALHLARTKSYDAVLCDLNLSSSGVSLSGVEAAKQVLAVVTGRKPVVIYMTGEYVEDSEPKPGEPLRLQKPFRISEVVAMLTEALSNGKH